MNKRDLLERSTSARQFLLFAVLVILLACCHVAHADDTEFDAVWKRQPKMEWAFDAALAADILTTLDIKNHPGYHETNAILGDHPSDARILGYGAACALIHMAITRELVDQGVPAKVINAWEWAGTAVEIGFAGHNYSIGLRFAL
jgi:hypothetical protein